jgi:hypothetical protein
MFYTFFFQKKAPSHVTAEIAKANQKARDRKMRKSAPRDALFWTSLLANLSFFIWKHNLNSNGSIENLSPDYRSTIYLRRACCFVYIEL